MPLRSVGGRPLPPCTNDGQNPYLIAMKLVDQAIMFMRNKLSCAGHNAGTALLREVEQVVGRAQE